MISQCETGQVPDQLNIGPHKQDPIFVELCEFSSKSKFWKKIVRFKRKRTIYERTEPLM